MKGNHCFLSCSLQLDIVIQLLVFKVKVYMLPRLWHLRTFLDITIPHAGGKHQPFTTTTQQSQILSATHNCKENLNMEMHNQQEAYLSKPRAGLTTYQITLPTPWQYSDQYHSLRTIHEGETEAVNGIQTFCYRASLLGA